MKINRIGMFHANFCGISSRTCGAGTYSINQLNALDKLNKSNLQQQIIPFWVGLDYAANITEGDGLLIVNNQILNHTQTICKKWDGETILVTKRDGSKFDIFWDESQWLERSRLTAKVIVKKIIDLHTAFTAIKVVANDIMYATLPKLILNELEDCSNLTHSEISLIKDKLSLMWVPHSTSKNYQAAGLNSVENNNNVSILREKLEQESINDAKVYNYTVGAIGEHFAQHLVKDYGLDRKHLKILKSGIFLEPYLNSFDNTVINEELTKLSIPLECNYIFDIGQGICHKGHDITIKAFAELVHKNRVKYKDLHLVLLAPERITQDPLHTQRINMLIEKLNITDKVIYISRWNANLAKYMYGCPRTLITLLPVRESPEDLIPMECRTNPINSILITSNIGSNRHQVLDGKDGFLVTLKNEISSDTIEQINTQDNLYLHNKDWVTTLEKVLDLAEDKRFMIIEAGKQKISICYDVVKNFEYNFIKI